MSDAGGVLMDRYIDIDIPICEIDTCVNAPIVIKYILPETRTPTERYGARVIFFTKESKV